MKILNASLSAFLAIGLLTAAAHGNEKVTLRLATDAHLALATGPHTTDTISRDRYFRLYHFPGMYSGPLAAQLRWLRTTPGRGTGPYFGDDGGDKYRFGRMDTVDATINAFVAMGARAAREQPGATYAAAGGSFPHDDGTDSTAKESKALVDPTMKVDYNRAVKPEHQKHAADLLVRWLDRMRQAGVPRPAFFSPVNEPDASWKSGPSGALDHAQFVKDVALRLREGHPDVRVSGPCTAWPYPRDTWQRWESTGWERAFIEKAGDAVGAYDFHLYTKDLWAYGPDAPKFEPDRKMPTPNLFESLSLGHSEIMEFGTSDVLLDLVQALHLAQWGTPAPPVIISEFGRQGLTPQKGPWANDYLYYLYGTTVTRLWMRFMDRPEIALTVPFILPESDRGHAPQRGQTLATRPGAPQDLSTQPTPLANWLAFFRDFAGQRIPAQWENLDPDLARGLFAIAARNDAEILVLLHNASPQPLEVNLTTDGLATWPTTARVSRMKWEGPIPKDHLTPTPPDAHWRCDATTGEALPQPVLQLAGEETILLRLPNPPAPSRQVNITRHYAPETLQPLDENATATFTFELTREMLEQARSAQLVLGFAAPHGPETGAAQLRVSWEGGSNLLPLGLTKGWKHISVPATLEIPVKDLTSGPWNVRVTNASTSPVKGSRIISARLDIRNELPISAP